MAGTAPSFLVDHDGVDEAELLDAGCDLMNLPI
jgi:hypothetical protein